jgi:hypothetical protein
MGLIADLFVFLKMNNVSVYPKIWSGQCHLRVNSLLVLVGLNDLEGNRQRKVICIAQSNKYNEGRVMLCHLFQRTSCTRI